VAAANKISTAIARGAVRLR